MPPGTRDSALHEHLQRLLEPAVRSAGLDLEGVAISSAGRRTVVRVIVDADGGADLDAVAEVSRSVSSLLDAESGELAGPFVLEVSSPGVDRPLTDARHWRRAVGRVVRVPVAGSVLTGRVVDTDDHGVRLQLTDGQRDVPWSELGRGAIQVEFTHAESDEEV